MSDKPYNYASRNRQEHDKFIKEQKLKEAQNIEDMQELFKDVRFRRFAWWFLELATVDMDAFTKDAETYHILGRQSTAHKLKRIAEIECPEDYIKMVQENAKRFQEKNKDSRKVEDK